MSMDAGVIVLAAGESKRMGQPKQLLPYRGKPLIGHAAQVAGATGLARMIVLGSNAELIRPRVPVSDDEICVSARWQEGMGTSIQAGLSALLGRYPAMRAVLVMLADQPLVTAVLVGQLLDACREGAAIAAAGYQDAPGVPAVFTRPFFRQLLSLAPNAGAKSILSEQRHQVRVIRTTLPTLDLDTPEDYQTLLRLAE